MGTTKDKKTSIGLLYIEKNNRLSSLEKRITLDAALSATADFSHEEETLKSEKTPSQDNESNSSNLWKESYLKWLKL